MNDDWRLTVDFDDEGDGGQLVERLGAVRLAATERRLLGDRVVVSRDGARVFLYAETEDELRRAEELVRGQLEEREGAGSPYPRALAPGRAGLEGPAGAAARERGRDAGRTRTAAGARGRRVGGQRLRRVGGAGRACRPRSDRGARGAAGSGGRSRSFAAPRTCSSAQPTRTKPPLSPSGSSGRRRPALGSRSSRAAAWSGKSPLRTRSPSSAASEPESLSGAPHGPPEQPGSTRAAAAPPAASDPRLRSALGRRDGLPDRRRRLRRRARLAGLRALQLADRALDRRRGLDAAPRGVRPRRRRRHRPGRAAAR